MNKLSRTDRAQILRMLVEGNSLRSTARLADVSINTVMKLLVDAGPVASMLQDEMFQDLSCQRLQCDEIWSFIGAKDKTIERNARNGEGTEGIGSVWTWTAIDADTKLIPAFMVGPRDAQMASEFMNDVASRLANRVQLTTDGHGNYLTAVAGAFGGDIDYAMLIKQYGAPADGRSPERRYSPAECSGVKVNRISGAPDSKHISTSYMERANLSIRMGNRRFTRLTNAFSKKYENHVASLSLYFFHYNLCRIHKTLRISPAMAANVTDRLWSMEDLVAKLEEIEAAQAAAAPVKPGRKAKNSN